MCLVWTCYSFVDGFLKNAFMCIRKEVRLINHDCLPILIRLYVMLAKLMLFAALSNAVSIMFFSYFFVIDFCQCFLFSCFVLVIGT